MSHLIDRQEIPPHQHGLAADLIADQEFSVRSEREDAKTHVLQLYGELDCPRAATLDSELRRAEQSDASSIVVDLSGLKFIDSAGITAIALAEMRSRANGRRLSFLRGTGQVERVLVQTGIEADLVFLD